MSAAAEMARECNVNAIGTHLRIPSARAGTLYARHALGDTAAVRVESIRHGSLDFGHHLFRKTVHLLIVKLQALLRRKGRLTAAFFTPYGEKNNITHAR